MATQPANCDYEISDNFNNAALHTQAK